MARPLALADIADQRAYERERDAFRREVIALKRHRRVAIGPLLTLVFENRTTVRFQIQEMARAERMVTDEQIQGELDAYNPLIPGRDECSATLFVELTNEEELRTWLPRLAGIERHIYLRVGEAAASVRVPGELEAAHAAQLTRPETTASVHYLRFRLDERTASGFGAGPVAIGSDLPDYRHEQRLSAETRASLESDWAVD